MAPKSKKGNEKSAPASGAGQTAGPRERLLAAGKALFAENGFESTSTSSIAGRAGTSESQLMRYFGGKAGLLEEIFTVGWARLHQAIGAKVMAAPTGRDAIFLVLQTMIAAFQQDEELAKIYLFEGRRMRGADHEVFISEGFLRFNELIRQLIRRSVADGSFRHNLPEQALLSALIGCAEGMIRDQIVARRSGKLEDFSSADIQKVVSAIFKGL